MNLLKKQKTKFGQNFEAIICQTLKYICCFSSDFVHCYQNCTFAFQFFDFSFRLFLFIFETNIINKLVQISRILSIFLCIFKQNRLFPSEVDDNKKQ